MITHTSMRRVQCRNEADQIVYAEVRFEARVDGEGVINDLAAKALRNKSRKAKIAGGNVVVEIVSGIPAGWKRTGY